MDIESGDDEKDGSDAEVEKVVHGVREVIRSHDAHSSDPAELRPEFLALRKCEGSSGVVHYLPFRQQAGSKLSQDQHSHG